jgi:hypothetical protein
VLYTSRLRLSFLSRSLLSGFLFAFCLYILACIHSLPFGSCFKPGFPGFVGKDYLSLVHSDGLWALFSHFWALRLYLRLYCAFLVV